LRIAEQIEIEINKELQEEHIAYSLYRERSFDLCHQYFISFCDQPSGLLEESNRQTSCLHLGWFLASFGMLRNSDLLSRNLVVFESVIDVVSQYPLWNVDLDALNVKANVDRLCDCYREINKAFGLGQVHCTETLATKVMLGVYGCFPALDTRVINFMKKQSVVHSSHFELNVSRIFEIYMKHQRDYIEARDFLRRAYYPGATLARALDLHAWILG